MTQSEIQAVPGVDELDGSYNASAITVLEGLEAVRSWLVSRFDALVKRAPSLVSQG